MTRSETRPQPGGTGGGPPEDAAGPPPAVPAAHVAAYAGLLRLAVRLLSREVDGALYRALIAADARTHEEEHPRFVSPGMAEGPETQALEELAVEFCRLFVGPEPRCLPYASAHRGEARLGGRAARDVRAFMERHQVSVLRHERDIVLDHDHLAVQLALLAHFYDVAGGAVAPAGLGAARAWTSSHELLHTHLLPWAAGWLDGLADAAVHPPYTTIARLLRAALNDATLWYDSPPPVPRLTAKDI